MGPAPLNVPASPSPNKSPKAPGPSVNGATKQPAAAKHLAPNDISSPHELTAFVRLSESLRIRSLKPRGISWIFLGWWVPNRSKRCLNSLKSNSKMSLLRSSNEVCTRYILCPSFKSDKVPVLTPDSGPNVIPSRRSRGFDPRYHQHRPRTPSLHRYPPITFLGIFYLWVNSLDPAKSQ